MEFHRQITRTPRPHEPDRGEEALAHVGDLGPEFAALIRGTAGCSPYLGGLIAKEGAWLTDAASQEPQALWRAFLAETAALPDKSLAADLRQAKRRAALYIALADLGGVWPLEQVTCALTEFADLTVDRALKAALANLIARKKLPGATEADVPEAAGVVAIAMGKMGAYELNYSSDIDLIMLFDSDRYDPDDFHEVRASLIRATRAMVSTLNDITADGYVFRTDLRLRPDASVTPVCLSMDAAESYYESVGRTWERAAYVKARASAGDIKAGERFLQALTPFVWRKHLDFAAIQDAHDMRLRIRAHKGLHGPITLSGHNMKLGRGGIREIEFFTQTRQIIAGGRDASLRVRGTQDGLDRLAAAGWVPAEAAEVLKAAYRAHREVEHRVQMVADAQTHDLPQDEDGFARLAAFMDKSVPALRTELKDRLEQVHEMTEGFFAPNAAHSAPAKPTDKSMSTIMDRWGNYPALRSGRAVNLFAQLKPEIVARLEKADKPMEALEQFDAFLKGLPAGVQVFSLFQANPQLIDLIVDIAATAPGLAQYLGHNSAVFDAVIGGDFFKPWPGREEIAARLGRRMDEAGDYESQLDTARRWQKEWRFRIGVHFLRGLMDAEEAGHAYADLAAAVLAALWPPVVAEFARKHGAPPGRGVAIMGMGSLGAGLLSVVSDLDLIVIYDAEGVDSSDGRRPLAARAYYARLTQAFVTALTAPMAEGTLYEVDMRLRPSGKQGPVATSWAAFQTYQKQEAWTWEHLALTRALPVAGAEGLGADVEAFRQTLLSQPKDRGAVVDDVIQMRRRLAEAKPGKGVWDVKQGPGRMQDIEMLAQCTALLAGSATRGTQAQLAEARASGALGEPVAERLSDIYRLYWQLQAASRLLTDGAVAVEALGAGGQGFLLSQTGAEDFETLRALLMDRAAEAEGLVTDALEALKQ